jgi:acyl transferase domain-containing protein
VFARHTARKQFCGIGSVKTNIGHLEPASGVAGLIKLLLCLRHELLPPTLNLDVPSPYIGFADTPFYPVVRATPPASRGAPRRATVSAMSFGGVNAHVVVEEPPPPLATPAPGAGGRGGAALGADAAGAAGGRGSAVGAARGRSGGRAGRPRVHAGGGPRALREAARGGRGGRSRSCERSSPG